jgi:hypothetical protein
VASSLRATLACSYVAAVGQGPQEEAFTRMKELLEKMAPLPDSFTTASHYSRLHLMVIEAIVLAFPLSDH